MVNYPNTSFDSEGKFIKKEREVMNDVGNNGGKITLDTILKISQIAILPALMALFYLLTMINNLEKRFVSIESQINAMPRIDILISKLAILEDRQNNNIRKIESIELELTRHRESSTYDPAGRNRRTP